MPTEQQPDRETLAPGRIQFALHSTNATEDPEDKRVNASVFAAKLATLVRGLIAADRAANGVQVHEYTIAELHTSTPTVVLAEQYVSAEAWVSARRSGIEAFDDCAQSVTIGDADGALQFGNCAFEIGKLANGADKRFGYGELRTGSDNVIRIDSFLRERAKAVTHPELVKPQAPPSGWFKGVVQGSFVGSVLAADLRGSLPEIKLVLSAGGKQLDCICRKDDIETIRSVLNKRVRVSGRAIYDGRSGLPRRIQITDIVPLEAPADFSRWKGSFEPFEPLPWDGEDA